METLSALVLFAVITTITPGGATTLSMSGAVVSSGWPSRAICTCSYVSRACERIMARFQEHLGNERLESLLELLTQLDDVKF